MLYSIIVMATSYILDLLLWLHTIYTFKRGGRRIFAERASDSNHDMPSFSLIIGYYFNPDTMRFSSRNTTRRRVPLVKIRVEKANFVCIFWPFIYHYVY